MGDGAPPAVWGWEEADPKLSAESAERMGAVAATRALERTKLRREMVVMVSCHFLRCIEMAW
jgi:hypothetical protein